MLEASYWNLQGKHVRARALMDEAERYARETENDWVQFEAGMERVRFAVAKNNMGSARRHLELARNFAKERGWGTRTQRCNKLLERLTVVSG